MSEAKVSADIANFGGYPIGVDRVDARFSRVPINNPEPLLDLIAAAIVFHIWALYKERPDASRNVLIFLSGGGLHRLGSTVRASIKTRVDRLVEAIITTDTPDIEFDSTAELHDTKALTLSGLSILNGGGSPVRRPDAGEPISRKIPKWFGQRIIPQLFPDSQARAAASWSALFSTQFLSVYRKSGDK